MQELCEEGTLQQAIAKKCFGGSRDSSESRSKLRSMLKAAREVVAGMQHLHSNGIIREKGISIAQVSSVNHIAFILLEQYNLMHRYVLFRYPGAT